MIVRLGGLIVRKGGGGISSGPGRGGRFGPFARRHRLEMEGST